MMVKRSMMAAFAVLGASAATSAWAVPLSFTVTGQVGAPTTDTASSLAALPQSTEAV